MDQITRQLRSQVCALAQRPTPTDGRRALDRRAPRPHVGRSSPTSVTRAPAARRSRARPAQVQPRRAARSIETATPGSGTREPVESPTRRRRRDAPILRTSSLLHARRCASSAERRCLPLLPVRQRRAPPQPTARSSPGNGRAHRGELEPVAQDHASTSACCTATSKHDRARPSLQNDVYVRTADPNATTPKPTCLTHDPTRRRAPSAASPCSS